MSADFTLYGHRTRAGLIWERAPSASPGPWWLGRRLREYGARSTILLPDGVVGFDPLPTRAASLLACVRRALEVGTSDSMIVVTREDDGPRHAVIVVVDGVLIPGGSDLVFADFASAHSHVEAMAADRDWREIVFDARIGELSGRDAPWRAHDFSTIAPAAADCLGPPGFLARWSSPKRLAGAGALVVALAAGLRWGPSLDAFQSPPPAPAPSAPRPVLVAAPKEFIETCVRAMNTHPGGLLLWEKNLIGCMLDSSGWGGSGARLVVRWRPIDIAEMAFKRLMADDELPERWPWFQVLEREASAALPIAVERRPARNFPDPSVWRHDVDLAFATHAKKVKADAAAGTMSVLSDYGLPVLADLAARVPGLEITKIESTKSGWKLTGRRVAAPQPAAEGGRP